MGINNSSRSKATLPFTESKVSVLNLSDKSKMHQEYEFSPFVQCRLTYVSRATKKLSKNEIKTIIQTSQSNNTRLSITGGLVSFNGIFLQTLEGDERLVKSLYSKIENDPRHTECCIIKLERDGENRLLRQYSNWSMKGIILDEQSSLLHSALSEMISNLVTSRIILSSYTQPRVLSLIQDGINPLDLEPNYCDKVVLFTDMCRYSTISEVLPPISLYALLQTVITLITNRVHHYGGEVTQIIGDACLCIFEPDYSDMALRCAQDIHLTLKRLQLHQNLPQIGDEDFNIAASPNCINIPVQCGFGLSFGRVCEGNFGSKRSKLDFSYHGLPVRLAQELESMTRKEKLAILFDEGVCLHVKNRFNVQFVGELSVARPVKYFTVVGNEYELVS